MNGRISTFLGAVLFGLVLLAYALVALTSAGATKSIKLDPKKAIYAKIPYSESVTTRKFKADLLMGQINAPHGWLMRECGYCGSTHRVLLVVLEDGIEMYSWRDNRATRRARARKGMHVPNPYSAESRGEPMRQDEFGER